MATRTAYRIVDFQEKINEHIRVLDHIKRQVGRWKGVQDNILDRGFTPPPALLECLRRLADPKRAAPDLTWSDAPECRWRMGFQ